MNRLAIATGLIGLGVGAAIGLRLGDGETPAGGREATTTTGAPVQWKMASAFPATLTLLGESGKRFESRLALISGGEITVKFYDPGALVPAFEIFDAVSAGAVDAGWSASGYWAGKMPAAQVFNSVPFGPLFNELIAWMRYDEGQQLYEALYHPHNVHPLVCFFVPQDGSGWFREPIEETADFAGLKVRYLGFGARVLEKFGASTQIIAGGDIYTALELGTIDATEFSMPAIDLELGFHEIAKHYYFPGWHQQATFVELIINLDRWRALPGDLQTLVETVCGDNFRYGIAEGEALQFKAIRVLQEKGVMIHKWPPEMLAAFEAAWHEVVAEKAAADADFARVWASLKQFREDYAVWRDLGSL